MTNSFREALSIASAYSNIEIKQADTERLHPLQRSAARFRTTGRLRLTELVAGKPALLI